MAKPSHLATPDPHNVLLPIGRQRSSHARVRSNASPTISTPLSFPLWTSSPFLSSHRRSHLRCCLLQPNHGWLYNSSFVTCPLAGSSAIMAIILGRFIQPRPSGSSYSRPPSTSVHLSAIYLRVRPPFTNSSQHTSLLPARAYLLNVSRT